MCRSVRVDRSLLSHDRRVNAPDEVTSICATCGRPVDAHRVSDWAGLLCLGDVKADADWESVLVRVVIVDAPGVADIVARCACDAEMTDREGHIGRGFTNLKRILGNPSDFAVVTGKLIKTVPRGHALAGCDEGSWALVGALACRLKVPAVLVRRTPKRYFVSYGDDPTVGDGRLVGERLEPGTPIHLVDDLVYTGQTLCAAEDALGRVGLHATSASAILWTRRAESSVAGLEACGLERVTCLVSQARMPD
jgi:adenine/guanine phosphoribosyltransferase-like PRPP-binding protein